MTQEKKELLFLMRDAPSYKRDLLLYRRKLAYMSRGMYGNKRAVYSYHQILKYPGFWYAVFRNRENFYCSGNGAQ